MRHSKRGDLTGIKGTLALILLLWSLLGTWQHAQRMHEWREYCKARPYETACRGGR